MIDSINTELKLLQDWHHCILAENYEAALKMAQARINDLQKTRDDYAPLINDSLERALSEWKNNLLIAENELSKHKFKQTLQLIGAIKTLTIVILSAIIAIMLIANYA